MNSSSSSQIDQAFDPLIPLSLTARKNPPLLCIPGAGASISSLVALATTVEEGYSIYGLEPRGIDSTYPPHESVQAAAHCNLRAIANHGITGPIHLLGHSHGGSVAFEMACLMQAQGMTVASLALVDSEPPQTAPEIILNLTDRELFDEFAGAIRLTFEQELMLDEDVLRNGNTNLFLEHLHGVMSKSGILPRRSSPDMLHGPFTTFSAARRAGYCSTSRYNGVVYLVQVSDPVLNPDADIQQRAEYAAGWRKCASELVIWTGPGHHFSILRQPHVKLLAQWWNNVVKK